MDSKVAEEALERIAKLESNTTPILRGELAVAIAKQALLTVEPKTCEEEAKNILKELGLNCDHVELLRRMVNIVSRLRANTVKVEQDRLHRKMNDYLLEHAVIGLIDVAIILSDDQEAHNAKA